MTTTTMTEPRPLTYDDLCETPNDGQRYEIIDGELVVTPSPVPRHQDLVTVVISLLTAFVGPRRLGKVLSGPIDVKISEYTILVPDLIFVSADRLAIIGPTYVDGGPDLVVEVLSPSTRRRDLVQKPALYAAAGVREYWQIDPDSESITINTLRDGRYHAVPADGSRVRSLVLPGLEVDGEAFFSSIE